MVLKIFNADLAYGADSMDQNIISAFYIRSIRLIRQIRVQKNAALGSTFAKMKSADEA